MLYAKVCSCVHTYTKAKYDVHAVFSVHVCHSHMDRIICSLLCACLFPLYFQVFLLGVYKQYTQLMSIEIARNSTGIWLMAHGCLDIGYFTKYTSGISYILMEIPTLMSHGWYSEVPSAYCISWLYDCTLMSTNFYCIYSCTPCTHCVGILTWVLRIWNIYIWYTKSTHCSTKRYIVYTTCIHPVLFSRLHIRPSHIYALSNITSSYCPSRLRMLASG